jgi:hypothetical protein
MRHGAVADRLIGNWTSEKSNNFGLHKKETTATDYTDFTKHMGQPSAGCGAASHVRAIFFLCHNPWISLQREKILSQIPWQLARGNLYQNSNAEIR